MSIQLRRGRHSVTHLKIHIIFVTKYRQKVLTVESLELIGQVFANVLNGLDCELVEFNGESDHVHSIVEYPPKLSVSKIANTMKATSSRLYGKEGYPKPYGKTALWSPSYFASSIGGAPLEVLKEYVQNQQSRPRRAGF